MSSVALVWLVVGLVSTAMVIAVLVGLIRHVLVLLRTVRRFGEEVSPIAQAIAQETQRASWRGSELGERGRSTS
jgi:hypothetical protein